MRRVFALAALVAALAVPGSALGFHHGFVPAPTCANENSGGNAGGANPTARAALVASGNHTLPLPPANTPGAEHSANTPAEENCAGA